MGHQINFVGTDLNVGLLFVFALSGLGFYGLILGGYASGNKYSLLGAARTAAQLVSYEVAMGLSVVGVLMLSREPVARRHRPRPGRHRLVHRAAAGRVSSSS